MKLALQVNLNRAMEGYFQLHGKYLIPQNQAEINTLLKAHPTNAIGANGIYAHSSWYHKGTYERTYIAYMQRQTVPYYMMPTITYYDHETKTLGPLVEIGLISTGVGDNHPLPQIMVDQDGYILVAIENIHNSPFYIRKSNSPEDISAFTLISTLSDNWAYPKWWNVDNVLYLAGRRNFNNTTLFRSSNGGSTWGSPIVIDTIGSGTAERSYSSRPSHRSNKYLWLIISRRLDAGNTWTDHMILKSPIESNGEVWQNVNNTFSRNVVSGGSLTLNDHRNYYRYRSSGADIENLQQPVCTVFEDVPYFTNRVPSNDTYEFGYFDFDLDSYVWKTIDIPDLPEYVEEDQSQPISVIYAYSHYEFDLIINMEEGGILNFRRYRTIDRGDNWTYIDTLFSNDGINYERMQLVGNFYATRKPIVIAQKQMTSDYSNIMVKEYYK